MILLSRSYRMNLAHVVAEDFSDAPAELHGHNFKVIVTVRGEISHQTGEVVSRPQLDQAFLEAIYRPFHNCKINEHWPSGTGEVIAQQFLRLLRSHLKNMGHSMDVVSVQLTETRKNRFQAYVDFTSVS